jgi:hypothetical protein
MSRNFYGNCKFIDNFFLIIEFNKFFFFLDLLESLGYSCTTSLSSLKKLFTLFPSVSFSSLSVAKLFGKIINTHAREIQLFMSEQSTWWFLSVLIIISY